MRLGPSFRQTNTTKKNNEKRKLKNFLAKYPSVFHTKKNKQDIQKTMRSLGPLPSCGSRVRSRSAVLGSIPLPLPFQSSTLLWDSPRGSAQPQGSWDSHRGVGTVTGEGSPPYSVVAASEFEGFGAAAGCGAGINTSLGAAGST